MSRRLSITKIEPPAGGASTPGPTEGHVAILQHAEWIARWIGQPCTSSRLLDFACGSGRHSHLAASRGFRVLAVDRDREALDRIEGKNIETRAEDLESGRWSFSAERFEVVVVTNFLHRARLDLLGGLLAPGGRLLYETFAVGNGRYGKPSNPAFLLQRCAAVLPPHDPESLPLDGRSPALS
jgi:SAM-dependent methyltransferase